MSGPAGEWAEEQAGEQARRQTGRVGEGAGKQAGGEPRRNEGGRGARPEKERLGCGAKAGKRGEAIVVL
jgi:hypothetical protein